MREKQVVSGDVTLHVVEDGDPVRPAIVFLHGFPDCHRVWEQQMEALAADYHVVGFDMRGVGRSSVSALPEAYRMDRLMADLAAVIDATCGPRARVHLVGHDWGSVIGWHFLCEPVYRRRVLSWTSMSGPHLGLLWGWVGRKLKSGRPAEVRKALSQLAHSWYIFSFQVPGLGRGLFRVLDRRLWRRVMRGGGVPAADPYLQASPEEVRAMTLEPVKIYQQNALKRRELPAPGSIDVPVLLLMPLRDRFIRPVVFEGLEEYVPDLTRVELDANHWAQRARPGELATLIRDFTGRVETELDAGEKQA